MNSDNKKFDEIILIMKGLKELKDIELKKQYEKLTRFENVEVLLKNIELQNENIKELNVNILELIKQNNQIINRLTSIANSNWANMVIISVGLLMANYSFISAIIKNNKKYIWK